MLDEADVTRAEGLLAAGLPQREVARRLAGLVGYGSVGRIFHGRRRARNTAAFSRPKRRCPECGATITTDQCQACRTRAKSQPRPAAIPTLAEIGGPLGLDLRPEHRRRYLRLRRQRAA